MGGWDALLDKDLREKIYRFAIDGKCQIDIASILVLSRQDVYYHIQYLIKHGYLSCKNSDEQIKIYSKTDRIYKSQQRSKKTRRRGRYDSCHGNICRVHQIGYICDVIKNPDVNVRWENCFKNNGTSYFDKHWNTDLGKVSIRMITTRFGSKIIFWMPEKYLDKNQLDHWTLIGPRYAKTVYNEIQKRWCCTLGPMVPYQKSHYAFEESSEFIFLSGKFNVSSDSSWVDESSGSPEWETNDISLAKVRLGLPEEVMKLKIQVSRIEVSLVKMNKVVSRVEGSVNRLLDLFSRPVPCDEFKDVV